MRVFLTGFSGSGKSTVGPKLARLLKYTYIDSDEEIERLAGLSIPEVFARKGERFFRQLEHKVIQHHARNNAADAVISLGGGAFISAHNRRIIETAGTTVYLRCELNELYRRLHGHKDRPLLFGHGSTKKAIMERMRQMLRLRRQFYEMADITVSTTTTTPIQTARKIRQNLRAYGQ